MSIKKKKDISLDKVSLKGPGGKSQYIVGSHIRERIENILEMKDTVVREIMVPRVDMNAVDINEKFSDILIQLLDTEHSRVPVYDGDVDNVIGILYVKDLLKYYSKRITKEKLKKLLRKPFYVPEEKLINTLLSEFRTKKIHLAIVNDELGGTSGLVTLEDIIEEIVGEIQDEYDEEEPLFEFITKSKIRFDPRILIEDAEEILKCNLPNEDSETLGGLLFQLFSRVPKKGEKIKYKKVTFKIESIKKNQIGKIIAQTGR